MLEVGFIVRTRSQKHDRRLRRLIAAKRAERIPLHVVKRSQLPDMTLIKYGRKCARTQKPVLQRVSHSRRRLSPIGNDPPLSRRRACNIHRKGVQVHTAARRDSNTRPEKMWIREQQRSWKQALVN